MDRLARDSIHLHKHLKRLSAAATEASTTMTSTTATITSSTVAESATSTIESYSTALNGVNTPLDITFQDCVWWSLGIFAMVVLVIRLTEMGRNHLRHMVAMSAGKTEQTYWSRNTTVWYPLFKKHFLYAPLGTKRHNREFKLGATVSMGTLPSRFHALMLGAYIFSNISYCVVLDYSLENKFELLASLRGRSGVLAIINMIALVLLAGRNNPLIKLLKVSFDTYNLLHRWMGRIVVLEAVIHTMAWAVVKHAADDWSGIWTSLRTDPFTGWGMVGTVAMILIVILSPGPFRHAFYETFLNLHILFAITAIGGVWVHCDVAGLPQLPYIQACVGLWIGDRVYRLYHILSCNYSLSRNTWTTATIETLPGEACRVTLSLPKYMTIKPGSHAYLRFLGVNPFETHPFSIAWVKHESVLSSTLPTFTTTRPRSDTEQSTSGSDDHVDFEKHDIPMNPYPIRRSHTTVANIQRQRPDPSSPYQQSPTKSLPPQPLNGLKKLKVRASMRTEVSFIIGAQAGMTRKLYDLASKFPLASPLTMRASLEGPYGGHHSLDSYGHVVLFAGSSGITHQIPYMSHLLTAAAEKLVATRKITLIWIFRDMDHLAWIKPFMDEILGMGNRREVLKIMLFVTRPNQNVTMTSQSRSVMCYPGRPNIGMLLKREVEAQCGAMAVTVCGPGGLQDNVREAVREHQEEGVIDFFEESFTW